VPEIKFNLFTYQPFRALFQPEAFKGRTDDQRPILIQKSRTGHLRHGTGGQFRHMASVCRICEVPQALHLTIIVIRAEIIQKS
jgi:hypothetical protein